MKDYNDTSTTQAEVSKEGTAPHSEGHGLHIRRSVQDLSQLGAREESTECSVVERPARRGGRPTGGALTKGVRDSHPLGEAGNEWDIHGELGDLRVVEIEGDPWFVGKDLCLGVGLKDHSAALRVLDDTEKRTHVFEGKRGGPQLMTVVSEAAVYYIVLRSHAATKPGTTAYRFRKWVTGEVLPQIRRSGSYGYDPLRPLSESEFLNLVEHFNTISDLTDTWRRRTIGVTGRPLTLYNQFNTAMRTMHTVMEAIDPQD